MTVKLTRSLAEAAEHGKRAHELEARQEAERRQLEEQRDREGAVQELVERFDRVLWVTVDPEQVQYGEIYPGRRQKAWVELEGWKWYTGYFLGSYHIEGVRPCPDCDGEIVTEKIHNRKDLYRALTEGGRPHEHWFAEDSTHPNAPDIPHYSPAEPDPDPIGELPAPSAITRLEHAIRDLIREEIAGRDDVPF